MVKMFNNFLSFVILILYANCVVLGFPISNIFGNFNIAKIETPFQVRYEAKTSLGGPNIIGSLTSGAYSNRFYVIPRGVVNPNNVRNDNISTTKPKQNDNVAATTYSFKNKTIVTDVDNAVPNFNDVDNSITNANTETYSPLEYTTEFTTDYTTTDDYDNTTIAYEEEVLNRSGVSPEVLASLLGK